MRAVDGERRPDLARPGAEVPVPPRLGPTGAHQVQPLGRLDRADQHRLGLIDLGHDDVQQVMNAVGEKHVSGAPVGEHGFGPRGATPVERVGRLVLVAQVRLGLDDPPGGALPVGDVNQSLPEQGLCDGHRVPAVKRAGQTGHA